MRYINVIINYFLPILQDTFKQWVSIFLEGTMSKPFYDYNCTSHVIYTATLNSRVVSSHTASGSLYKVNHFHLHIIQSTTLIQLKRPTTTLAGGKAKKKKSIELDDASTEEGHNIRLGAEVKKKTRTFRV